MKMTTLDKVTYTLLVIGGLNWGLVGAFETDLVGEVFGFGSGLSRFIYVLVGLAALNGVYTIYSMMSKGEKS